PSPAHRARRADQGPARKGSGSALRCLAARGACKSHYPGRVIEYRNLKSALLGRGTVRANLVDLLATPPTAPEPRVGTGLEVIGVLVRDVAAERSPAIPAELLTTDAESIIPAADIVVELLGGIEPAKSYILQALSSGADVVTANKALLATHGP